MNLRSGYGLLFRAVLFLLLGAFFLWKALTLMPGTTTVLLWIFALLDFVWALYLLYAFVRGKCRRR